MSGSSEFTTEDFLSLFRVKKTSVKMMKSRGYIIDRDESGFLDPYFDAIDFGGYCEKLLNDSRSMGLAYTVRDVLQRIYRKPDPTPRIGPDGKFLLDDTDPRSRVAFVIFLNNSEKRESKTKGATRSTKKTEASAIGVDTIKLIMDNSTYSIASSIILFGKTKLSPAARERIKSADRTTYEFYQDREMQFDPTSHVLVPKHTLIPRKEAVEKARLAGTNNYPTILSKDPISIFQGFVPGDLIEIVRPSVGTLVTQKTVFRKVIPGSIVPGK